jgi:hypothetical protein
MLVKGTRHKVLTYVEYRAVSGVFKNIDPPPPLHPASLFSRRTKDKGRGVHTRRAMRGWGVNILEDAGHWIGLLQYNPSTVLGHPMNICFEETSKIKSVPILSVDTEMLSKFTGCLFSK